jgi:hypothetical protein
MASKFFPRQAGTTEQSFQIGAGNGKFPFIFDSSLLTAIRTWFLPNSNGANGDVLTTDGAGNLSWASPGAVTVSGVIVGDTDCGLLSDIITSNVDFGSAGNLPYITMN